MRASIGWLVSLDADGHPYVEMLFPGDTAKLILDSPPPAGHTAALFVYNTHSQKSVVETDQDLLTKEEYKQYPREAVASLRDELITWIDHKCCRRHPHRGSRNAHDVWWV